MATPFPATESRPAGASASHGGPLVLFDGVCNLCNATVNFLIDRDRRGRLRFAALQSSAATNELRTLGVSLPEGPPESLLLVEGGRVYQHSTAALRIARHLTSPGWRLAPALLAVPRPLRDAVYRWVAKNRYRWFGRSDVCRVPTADLRSRFLE
jgi:predicted DCC family thiol-disulfide oxidoreductase YuxK